MHPNFSNDLKFTDFLSRFKADLKDSNSRTVERNCCEVKLSFGFVCVISIAFRLNARMLCLNYY